MIFFSLHFYFFEIVFHKACSKSSFLKKLKKNLVIIIATKLSALEVNATEKLSSLFLQKEIQYFAAFTQYEKVWC